MKESKHERAATECEGDAGSIMGSALNEAGMARRNFLGFTARCSAALAAFGLGSEALMQAVSSRSIMSSAGAAGATRNRQLHPFPSDDPFNMPIGVNAWYAPSTDPATQRVNINRGFININNGVSHPVIQSTAADPVHTINMDTANSWCNNCRVESYRPAENGTLVINERFPTNAVPSGGDNLANLRIDRQLHAVYENELIEMYRFRREGGIDSGIPIVHSLRTVRNRLDHYSFGRGNSSYPIDDPLKNVAGVRAWGGSAIAGLIRYHEVETATPHIPHALCIIARQNNPRVAAQATRPTQIGRQGQGDPSSPLLNVRLMFPAINIDRTDYQEGTLADGTKTASMRMGMRFALPPYCTDAWIDANAPKLTAPAYGHPAGTPNPWQVALARAARDYGMIVGDSAEDAGGNIMSGTPGISMTVENLLTGGASEMPKWIFVHLRRIAGGGASPIHNPLESHWKAWANAGEGWGGGAPRVPYSPPLAPLSGDVPLPLSPPEAPPGIQVTGARTFDGTG